MRRRLLLVLPIWVLCSLPAVSHESRPALLQLTETAPGRYEVLWKRPQRGDLTLGLRVAWPAGCRDLAPPSRRWSRAR